MGTLYDVLKVSSLASPEELKTAYRKLVRSSHPDLGGDVDVFRKVQEAWETLNSPNKRANYDSKLLREKASSSRKTYTAPAYAGPKTYNAGPKPQKPPYTEDFLNDFFDRSRFYAAGGDSYYQNKETYTAAREEARKAAREKVKAEEQAQQARRQKANSAMSSEERYAAYTEAERKRRESDSMTAAEREAAYFAAEQKRHSKARSESHQKDRRTGPDLSDEYKRKIAREKAEAQWEWETLGTKYKAYQTSSASYATVQMWKARDTTLNYSFVAVAAGGIIPLLIMQFILAVGSETMMVSFPNLLGVVVTAVFVTVGGRAVAFKAIWNARKEQFLSKSNKR